MVARVVPVHLALLPSPTSPSSRPNPKRTNSTAEEEGADGGAEPGALQTETPSQSSRNVTPARGLVAPCCGSRRTYPEEVEGSLRAAPRRGRARRRGVGAG